MSKKKAKPHRTIKLLLSGYNCENCVFIKKASLDEHCYISSNKPSKNICDAYLSLSEWLDAFRATIAEKG